MLTAEVWPAISACASVGALCFSAYGVIVANQVKHLANGMKTELVAEVRAASLAKGQEEGRLEQEVGIVAQPQPRGRPKKPA